MAKRRSTHWGLLETHQASGAETVRHLLQQNITHYRPLYRPPMPNGGVRQPQNLFPGYLFVQVDTRNSDWSRTRSTRGVKQLHMMGEKPAVVLDDDIEFIRSREDALGYFVPEHEEPPVFFLNDRVRGIHGLFEDKIGIYKGLGKNKRDSRRVLFEILNRSVEFEVNAYDLTAHYDIAV